MEYQRAARVIQTNIYGRLTVLPKAVVDLFCDDAGLFTFQEKSDVWTWLSGRIVPRESVTPRDIDHIALFMLEHSKSVNLDNEDCWMILDPPHMQVFFDMDDVWEDPQGPENQPANTSTCDFPDLPTTTRPARDKKKRTVTDVCDKCRGNGCRACRWQKNMW